MMIFFQNSSSSKGANGFLFFFRKLMTRCRGLSAFSMMIMILACWAPSSSFSRFWSASSSSSLSLNRPSLNGAQLQSWQRQALADRPEESGLFASLRGKKPAEKGKKAPASAAVRASSRTGSQAALAGEAPSRTSAPLSAIRGGA